MPGFDNDTMFAKNVDFSGADPVTPQVTADGQLMIGSGVAPNIRVGSIASAGGTVAITAGAGTINLECGGTVPITFTAEDASTATPALGNINIVGNTTNGISTTAAGSTVTVGMESPLYADFSFTNLTPATPRNLTIVNTDVNAASTAELRLSVPPGGADSMVVWETMATGFYSAGVDNSDADTWKLTNSSDTSSGNTLIGVTSAGVISLHNDLDVTEGGTGVSTLTSHGILLGNGAGDIQATAEPSDGQLLIGDTGGFPILATLTAPAAGIDITNGAGSITFSLADDLSAVEGLAGTGVASRTAADTWTTSSITENAVIYGGAGQTLSNLGPLTNGQLVIGSTGVAPVAATLTAGDGVDITNAAGSITIAVEGDVLQSVPTDAGTATPAAGSLSILGGTSVGGTATNINTIGAGSTVSVCLNNSISQPTTNAAGTTGMYSLGGNRFLHNYGSSGPPDHNTFLGKDSGNLTLTSFGCTGIGALSLQDLSSGQNNSGFGYASLANITSGEFNSALGSAAGYSDTTHSYNTYLGYNSGYYHSDNGNTAVGYRALRGNAGGSSGTFNVAVGYDSLNNNVSGQANVCLGAHSGSNLTTGGNNVYAGYKAGQNASSANYGVAIGREAIGELNATGFDNCAIGYQSMYKLTSGEYNSCYGSRSGYWIGVGSYNTCAGKDSLFWLTNGSYNVSLGHNSSSAYTGAESSNIVVSNAGVLGESNKIRIGTQGSGNGQQDQCYIAGIASVAVSNKNLVTINTSTGQLGSQTIANLTTWSVISADQTAVVGEGYFCNKAGTLALALPVTSAVSDVIECANINTATGTQITQAAGQQVFIGNTNTTAGAGGSLTSTATGDCLKLVCRTANTTWQVVSSMGNWTVV